MHVCIYTYINEYIYTYIYIIQILHARENAIASLDDLQFHQFSCETHHFILHHWLEATSCICITLCLFTHLLVNSEARTIYCNCELHNNKYGCEISLLCVDLESFDYILRNDVAGSLHLHSDFHSSCTTLHCHPQYKGSFFSNILLNICYHLLFFMIITLTGLRWDL